MEDYPKNSVQHNLAPGLVIIANAPSHIVDVTPGASYMLRKDDEGTYFILDNKGDERRLEHLWDTHFNLDLGEQPEACEQEESCEGCTFPLSNCQCIEEAPATVFTKKDIGKNRLELIQPEFIEGLGSILTFGADKYSANNWKLGNDAESIDRIKGALLRHQMAYLKGEKLDPETGFSHLYHMTCNLMFLDYFDRRDDEPS